MAPDADPYRTLGLSRDATLEEVRRAYRRLAKANHPDAAGEAALPRFLAIRAAYDQIAGPDARARRPGATRPTSPRRAGDAEGDRTDATYRAYGGRARRGRPMGGPGPARGPSEPPPGAGRPSGQSRSTRPERPPNKATLGSTSYDGAEGEPFEPDWGGASWYGTTSGTYWTLNPKEYADPRKHGPEYQARARRKMDGRGETDAPDVGSPLRRDEAERSAADEPRPSASETSEGAGEPRTGAAEPRTGPAARPTTPPATHSTSSWWEATDGHPPRSETSADSRTRPGERRPSPGPGSGQGPWAGGGPSAAHPQTTPTISPDAILQAIRTWLDDAHPGTVGRVGRALVGWAPTALGIGWLGGEISGCGRFAAGCDATLATAALMAQVVALLVLILIGPLARIASVATLATLAAAIPAAVLLSATAGNPDDATAGRLALSGLLLIAWVVGLAFGLVRELRGVGLRRRGPPGPSGPARPVS